MTQACTDHSWAGDPFPQVTHDFTGTHMKMYDNKLLKNGRNGMGGYPNIVEFQIWYRSDSLL